MSTLFGKMSVNQVCAVQVFFMSALNQIHFFFQHLFHKTNKNHLHKKSSHGHLDPFIQAHPVVSLGVVGLEHCLVLIFPLSCVSFQQTLF